MRTAFFLPGAACTAFLLLASVAIPTVAQQHRGSSGTVEIRSDSSSVSGLTGEDEVVFSYSGNVQLTNGSVEITGNEAVITMNHSLDAIVHARVTGNPAYFQRQAEPSEVLTTGHSESIEYFLEAALVVFQGDVSFNQPGVSYECASLSYNIESDLAEGSGNCAVTYAK